MRSASVRISLRVSVFILLSCEGMERDSGSLVRESFAADVDLGIYVADVGNGDSTLILGPGRPASKAARRRWKASAWSRPDCGGDPP